MYLQSNSKFEEMGLGRWEKKEIYVEGYGIEMIVEKMKECEEMGLGGWEKEEIFVEGYGIEMIVE
jgi:hypothetical protein